MLFFAETAAQQGGIETHLLVNSALCLHALDFKFWYWSCEGSHGFQKVPCTIYTVFQKKTSTHIIGYKLRNSCPILIIFDIKILHII